MYSLSHYYIINRIPYVAGCRYLGPILCEIEDADRKRKTAFFYLDFSIRKNA